MLEDQNISKLDVLKYLQEVTSIEKETINSIAESAFSMADYILRI